MAPPHLKLSSPLVLGGAAVTPFLVMCLMHLRRTRSYTFPESYFLENTIKVVTHMHDLLDYMWSNVVDCEKRGFTAVHLNIFSMLDICLTNDVECVTHILKTNFDNYGKGPDFKYRFGALLGDGIFNVDGKQWYAHRKTSAHLFNMNRFRSTVLDTFNSHCNIVIDILKASVYKKEAVDIQRLMMKFTLDSIGVIAFGQEIGSLKQDRVVFAEAFDYCQESINQSFMDPLWMFKRLFSPWGWWYFKCLRDVEVYAGRMVSNCRKQAAENAIGANTNAAELEKVKKARGGGDLISLYLERQPELTDKDLRDIMMNFIIAGRDTTAQALSWSFFELCVNEKAQDNMRDEVDALYEKHYSSSTETFEGFTYDQLGELKYVEAACMEVIRLHPSVPKEAKYAFNDDVLPDGTQIRKGDTVIFCPWIMGRTERLWENALAFRPERFLENAKPSAYVFTAFQAGPRVCLGQQLALLEMKCCLARLLRTFKFTLAQDANTVTYCNTITLPIKNGLKVNVSLR